jgi:hypothetical protein
MQSTNRWVKVLGLEARHASEALQGLTAVRSIGGRAVDRGGHALLPPSSQPLHREAIGYAWVCWVELEVGPTTRGQKIMVDQH